MPGDSTEQPSFNLDDAITKIYPELRRIARALMARERRGHTLVPTALVNETVLKLLRLRDTPITDERSFLRIAVVQMRRVLIEHARKKLAQKRFGHQVELSSSLADPEIAKLEELILIDQVLDRILKHGPVAHQVVTYRFFAGLTIEEVAATMNIGLSTVQREWEWARLQLFNEIQSVKQTLTNNNE